MHKGNALEALGRHKEARECYLKVLPILENEPRSTRVDWEVASAIVNIANSYSREGDFDSADKEYKRAEQLGADHLDVPDGNKADGMNIKMVAMRSRAFALQKAGREEEAKSLLREVLDIQKEYGDLMVKEREDIRNETMKRTMEATQAGLNPLAS